jgi:DNA-binding transcriptional LysR family regulator
LQRDTREASQLRDGSIDIDIGVAVNSAPEMKMQVVYEDEFAGVVRNRHPVLQKKMTPKAYSALAHVNASRRGLPTSPIDQELEKLGLVRSVPLVVPSFWAAVGAVANSDMATAVPRHFVEYSGVFRDLHVFNLPVSTPKIQIVSCWHPRLDNDAAHQWLRECVRESFKLRVAQKKRGRNVAK